MICVLFSKKWPSAVQINLSIIFRAEDFLDETELTTNDI